MDIILILTVLNQILYHNAILGLYWFVVALPGFIVFTLFYFLIFRIWK